MNTTSNTTPSTSPSNTVDLAALEAALRQRSWAEAPLPKPRVQPRGEGALKSRITGPTPRGPQRLTTDLLLRLAAEEEGCAPTGSSLVRAARQARTKTPTALDWRKLTEAKYVGIVRSLADPDDLATWEREDPEIGGVLWARPLDNRLISVWVGMVCPTRAARVLRDWRCYWRASVPRPSVVGSSHNPPVEAVAIAYLQGWPSWAVRVFARARRLPGAPGPWGVKTARQARALGRSSAKAPLAALLGADAIAFLGRLGPEEQGVVLGAVQPRHLLPAALRAELFELAEALGGAENWGTDAGQEALRLALREPNLRLRARDLPLQEVRGDLRALGNLKVRVARASGARQEELARQLLGLDPGRVVSANALVAHLTPQYPGASLAQASRIVLGESPRDLAGPVPLSKREAHQWLAEDPNLDAGYWYLRRIVATFPPEVAEARVHPRRGGWVRLDGALRDWEVAQWLSAVVRRGGWAQLTRERPIHGPDVPEGASFRFLDLIDEIQEADLVRGDRTSVEEAFRASAERVSAPWRKENAGKPLCGPRPRGLRPHPHIHVLRTLDALQAEGDALDHCVGGYGPAVQRGSCWILSIRVPSAFAGGTPIRWDRSTVELDDRVAPPIVRQHRGRGNDIPPASCIQALKEALID